MALTVDGLTTKLVSSLSNIDVPENAIKVFWDTICLYFKENAEVTYNWVGKNPSGMTEALAIKGTLKVGSTLSLCFLSDPDEALADMSKQINKAAATWTVIPPTGFVLTPMYVIPSVALGKSEKTEQKDAITAIASDIINGIKSATASSTGNHGAFVGTATFTSIL